MREYWRKPEESKVAIRDGWHRTGDMGFFDDENLVRSAPAFWRVQAPQA